MNEIPITVPLLNEILAYLGGRPFIEVAQLIGKIQEEIKRVPHE